MNIIYFIKSSSIISGKYLALGKCQQNHSKIIPFHDVEIMKTECKQ